MEGERISKLVFGWVEVSAVKFGYIRLSSACSVLFDSDGYGHNSRTSGSDDLVNICTSLY